MSARTGSNIEAWLAPRWSRGSAALARPLPPHASAAAIRIPERLSAQLALVFPPASPQLFIHEGARQGLERKLKAMSPGRVVILSITDNRHSIISHSMRHRVLPARTHHMFLAAPARVVNAIVRYVTRGHKRASQLVGNYIKANGARPTSR